MVALLIELGADVELQTIFGKSAAQLDHASSFNLLLDAGVPINCHSLWG